MANKVLLSQLLDSMLYKLVLSGLINENILKAKEEMGLKYMTDRT